MFYIESFVNGKSLDKVWQTANDIKENTDVECDPPNLPEICRNLDTWISSEAFEIRKRLSLRTSAILVNGAARLYKAGLHKLLEDVKILDDKMAHRKRNFYNISSDSYDSSESPVTPEEMRHVTQNFETSITPNKRPKSSAMADVSANNSISRSLSRASSEKTAEHSQLNNDLNSSISDIPPSLRTRSDSQSASSEHILVAESSQRNINLNQVSTSIDKSKSPENLEEPKNTSAIENQIKDQEVQTCPVHEEQSNNDSFEDGLDKNLPFAYILVHDSYHSRVPSKIILSSVNSDVRNLI